MLARWRPLRPSSILHRTFQNASSRTNPSPRPPPPPSGLSHSYVESKLSSFPSDLAALGFFLWCARQPNYFHGPGPSIGRSRSFVGSPIGSGPSRGSSGSSRASAAPQRRRLF
ncbi:hypothetical protein QJS10_CPA01g02969 [Acorus calamus]|uniref:Uncharacterized protein n=1 Tax=Acorus calamus TaxID=4465 RepID=A0AAV9FJX3_ACOCL|nr:hypothetical protein QJS10_CPA01g02969 [Acorus calamus]